MQKLTAIKQNFASLFSQNQLHHANLIYGRKGLGKYQFTKNLINNFLDNKNDFHPDFLEISKDSDKKEITIDKIRELSALIIKTSAVKNYKFILINTACELNKSSANAVLKMLEEPIKNNYFFLIANNLNRVLPTIKSRCNLIKFPEPEISEFRQSLKTELTKIDDQEIDFLAEICDLAYLKAVENADKLTFLYKSFIKSIVEKAFSEELIKKISEKNFNFSDLSDIITFFCYRFIKFRNFSQINFYFDEKNAFNILSQKFSDEKFFQIKEEILILLNNSLRLNMDKKSAVVNIFNLLS